MKTNPACVLLLACLLAGSVQADDVSRMVTDGIGMRLAVPSNPQRVVALAPNLAEIACLLDRCDVLVGRTTGALHPESVRDLPSVGGMSKPSLEAIVSLKPDLVLATTEGNPPAVVERLRELGVPAYTVDRDSTGIEGILQSVRRMGDVLNARERAEALIRDSRRRLKETRNRTRLVERPRALLLVWTRPPVTAGGRTYLHDILEAAGGRNVAAQLGDWPRLGRETLLSLRPDVILVADAMSGEAPPGIEDLKTIPGLEARWVRVSGDPLLRPSPKALDSLEELHCALHPKSCADSP